MFLTGKREGVCVRERERKREKERERERERGGEEVGLYDANANHSEKCVFFFSPSSQVQLKRQF